MIGQGKSLDKPIKEGMRWLLRTIEANFMVIDARVKNDVTEQLRREKEEKKAKAERVRKIREER